MQHIGKSNGCRPGPTSIAMCVWGGGYENMNSINAVNYVHACTREMICKVRIITHKNVIALRVHEQIIEQLKIARVLIMYTGTWNEEGCGRTGEHYINKCNYVHACTREMIA